MLTECSIWEESFQIIMLKRDVERRAHPIKLLIKLFEGLCKEG